MDDDRLDVAAGAPREQGLVQRVRRRFQQSALPVGASLLVGFSGGADSLCLLAALAALGRTGFVRVFAVHVDHGLRPSSQSEAVVACDVAAQLGVPCSIVQVERSRLERHVGVGLEEAARRERWRAFAGVGAEHGVGAVALGHHRRDQAETVLLHLARGAGLAGAVGMLPLTTMRVPWWDEADATEDAARTIRVWRPLLDEPVAEVRTFAERLGLPIVEDPSNDDLALRRNAVRHEVLPTLERAIPGAEAGLARFASLVADDEAELDRQAATFLAECSIDGGLRRSRLMTASVSLRRRVVRRWLGTAFPMLEVSADRVDAVLRVAGGSGPRRVVEIGVGIAVVVDGDLLHVQR